MHGISIFFNDARDIEVNIDLFSKKEVIDECKGLIRCHEGKPSLVILNIVFNLPATFTCELLESRDKFVQSEVVICRPYWREFDTSVIDSHYKMIDRIFLLLSLPVLI